MKQELRRIYDDLSHGKLSQAEALEQIRALKLQEQDGKRGALLARPVWQADDETSPVTAAEFAERHLVLCELPGVDVVTLGSLLPQCELRVLNAPRESTIAERYSHHVLACLDLLQSVLRAKRHGKVLVQVAISADEPLLAGLSGLLKTAALENPQIAAQLIVMPANVTTERLVDIIRHEQLRAFDALVRYENNERQVLRWRELAEEPTTPFVLRDHGVYLITGGLGSLGVLFAREILERSHAHVVLVGRSPLTADKQAVLDSLSRASYRQCDVTDLDQVTQLVDAIQEEHGRLDGILHSAGLIADNFILKKTHAEVRDVLAPKILGTLHLDDASRNAALDFFVLFSSFAGAFGNVGQADYAVANAFLDHFAAQRNRQVAAKERYGRTLSINWPFWQDGGMGLDAAGRERLQQHTGMQPMQTATGLHAFGRCLTLPYEQVLVAEGDLAEMRVALFSGRPIETEPATVDVPASAPDATLEEKTREYLRKECADVLKLPVHRIDPQAALEAYGIDSILAMKLTNHLERTFGTLSKTLFFEYQTIAELSRYFVESHAAHLAALLAPDPSANVPARTEARVQSRRDSRRSSRPARNTAEPGAPNDAIAIIGLSGRYPEALDVRAYWRNLREGKDCIVEIPKERWDWREYFSEDRTKGGHHYSKWGGFIAGVDEFDALFFNISPKEAKTLDPQERLFLQHAWMAIEDAGYTRAGLQAPRVNDLAGQVGVYVGVMYTEYQLFGVEASQRGNRVGVAGSAASIANRVSYALNLHGPSVTLDTMCSSSLTAIHYACQDLKLGRTSLAIAGGVNVTIHPNKYLGLSAGQFISSDGHCQSFGEGGDGYIPGEGVGAVLLKRLAEAERDGDHIYGVIRGSALNHGGKTNGYTVPNPQAQAGAISQALAESGVDARHVSYIEAHGTGTKLGDPIEIAALNKAFRHYTAETGFCRIGSAKSNIGHCESAAGMAGLTKVLLQMQHEQIVPSLHSAQLNPHIDFDSSPFVVNQTLTPWERPVIDGRTLPRIAGISSFGAGGSNAHLIVEEYPARVRRQAAVADAIIPLSARTPEQLQQKTADLLAFLRERAEEIDLAAMAFTLQTGREAMDERLSFVVSSVEQLIEKLQAYLAGKHEDVHRGNAKRNPDAVVVLSAADGPSRVAAGWVEGGEVDWSVFHGETAPQRISLPTYPFAKDRHWIDVPQLQPAASTVTTAVLHPLLHTNTSDLAQQSYSSTFTGEEPFLRGQRTFPAAAALDMAREAVQRSARPSDETAVELRDVVWGDAIAIESGAQVDIALLPADGNAIDFEIYSGDVIHCQGRAHLVPRHDAARIAEAPEVVQSVRREIPFTVAQPVERKKPGAITLAAPGARGTQASGARAPITLATTRPVTLAAPAVALYDDGDGIFSIEVKDSADAINHLKQALDRAQQEATLKVLIVRGIERCFVRDAREDVNAAVELHLVQSLASFPYPVIAALTGDAVGAPFLAAALCDFIVCNEDATYGYTDTTRQLYPTSDEAALFAQRFGEMRAQDLLYISGPATGSQLRVKGWTCPIVPATEVESFARKLASTLAAKPQTALRVLKQHLTRHVATLAGALTPVDAAQVDVGAANVEVVRMSEVADLAETFTAIQQNASCKAIVLVNDASDGVTPDAVRAFQRVVLDSPIPVVAALDSDARGNAWLLGQSCDACVYSRTANYSPAGIGSDQIAIFAARLGDAIAREILLHGGDHRGAELERRIGTVIVAEADRVLDAAMEIATFWTRLPRTTLSSWKQQTKAALDQKIRSLAIDAEQHDDAPIAPPAPITLQSRVVTATADADGIVVVRMEDRDAKNMFSDALRAGLREAFTHIAQSPAYKVVVLTGYDRYFASGGTKDSLLAIHSGAAQFTDHKVFQLPLDCPLPVIAAMQGHGIGAGWTLGLFADFALFSEESRYVSPYMDYGFTPGAGATLILAERLGEDIARESQLSAQHYNGAELKAREVRLPIVPRSEAVPAALGLARQIARASRARLVTLKRQLTRSTHEALEDTYRREVAMHEQTFVGQSETLARIQDTFFEEAAQAQPQSAPAPSSDSGEFLRAVAATLRTLLANELQMRESDIGDNTQFIDLGLDSIGGVTWIRKINEKYQTAIEATKIYNYPTLAELSRYVKEEAERVMPAAAPPAPEKVAAPQKPIATAAPARKLTSWRGRTAPRPAVTPAATSTPSPIAIIGMAGQFPQANDIEAFWQNIAQGKNCIVEVPSERWDVNAYYQPGDPTLGKTNSKWVGALETYDRFDPLFFNISPAEAESMDPQQRLFLQASWHCIENAGYDARSLSGSKCGVFAGCACGDYHLLTRDQQLSGQSFTGDAPSILPARASYFLNLQGPCLSIDTACSSSLVAIAQACDSLNAGSSDLALAGGVYVMTGPEMHIRTSQVGMLSAEGRCFTFDQRADGLVPGEGVGVVLLKRLADAERDGDVIHAVIHGWGVNQDGKTNGITAPNPDSQTRLEQEVYDKYQIDPASIQLIEAHGTGTKLGDPIEVEGLKKAFAKYTHNTGYCALGSVKSNIGHCLTAAGIAGVLKLVLALKHKQLPPTIHFEQLNEHIQLDGTPFYVNTRLQDWELRGAPRRQSAISSFGFSGTNAHMVIGEYVPPAGRPTASASPDAPVIVPLSARTAEQLRQRARDLSSFLRENADRVDLASIAYTLQVGRTPMDERLGFVVSSVEQLRERLEAYVGGAREIAGFYEGQVKRSNEALSLLTQNDEIKEAILDKWIAGRKLAKLLELWVRGVEMDWNRVHGAVKPQRIALPVYPFAKERYWIDTARQSAIAVAARNVLHPLLHDNTSDLDRQSYSATFRGDEFFLADHQVRADGENAQKVLPGVAYLEMARAAVERALPAHTNATTVELRDIVWVQPVTVDEATRIEIALIANDTEEIEYEIYSRRDGEDVVHGQGRAWLRTEALPAKLDLPQIERELTQEAIAPQSLYAAFDRMGLLYGPAFQGIVSLRRGNGRVLAQLRLPKGIENTFDDLVLHPSLLDSAVQACAGLIDETSEAFRQPRVPFALDSLRILGTCSEEMIASVSYAPGSHAGSAVVKLDIDLCHADGTIAVQMHGFSLRVMSREAPAKTDTLLATPVWQAVPVTPGGNFAERHVLLCDAANVNVEQLRTSLPQAQCISLQSEDESLAARYSHYAVTCFERIRAILQSKPQDNVLVQIVVVDDVCAGLSALLRTATLENPRLAGQVILVGPECSTDELSAILRDETGNTADALVRYASGTGEVLRWQELETHAEPPVAFREDGIYLITGGLGALGTLFTNEILARTSRAQVVLTGRAPLDGRTLPDRVRYRQLDLNDLDQVRQLVDSIRRESGRLDGILHAAGTIADEFILKKDAAAFASVLAPKVTGTFHLDEATKDVALDFFVLFSSIAAATGNLGQADYACANAFLDHFAAYRNAQVAAGRRHGRTRSIDWPLWEAGGMTIDPASYALLEKTSGVRPMRTETGIVAFHRSVALPYDRILVAEGNAAKMRAAFVEQSAPARETQPVTASIPAENLTERTQDYLVRQLSGVLKMPAHAIDALEPLEKYGIDSILALKLTSQLEQTFGALSKTLFFEYQTIAELTGYFVQSHAARLAALFAGEIQTAVTPAETAPIIPIKASPSRRFGRSRRAEPAQSEAIAIIGLSGRYPEAIDVEAYWQNLRDGKDCIVEVPADRWDWKDYFSDDRTASGRHFSKWGGFIAGVDEFDPLFFNIAPKDAKNIDPQERLFLQHAWMAIEDAGYTRSSLQMPFEHDIAGQVGVYAGVMYNEYQLFGAEASARGNPLGVAGSASSIANRVSYALNLHGPSMTLDTMCSSSLTAIHLACQDLKLGRTSLAIAGGVNVSIHPNKYLVLSAGQFISSDGHCQSFGEGGDGYIPGEGVGVVVLKRLSDAERDGDHIYGVIRGSALNHGGKTNGYTVPNPQAQSSVISRALADAKIDARHISYIEAHGTGTKLGDPIEISALSKAFQHHTQDTGFCPIGSAKSNIGHCESAAGIAGLTKVLLQMQHRQLAPSLHSAQLNPLIEFSTTPFVVNQTLRAWEPPVIDGRTLPRIAGISSFGAGGSNAHMIVEEYAAPARVATAAKKVAIVLSARTAEQLQQKVRDLARFVRARIDSIDLAALAYTLQVGREAMEERLAFVVSSVAQLLEKLERHAAGDTSLEDAYQGQARRHKEALSLFSTDGDLLRTIDQWIAGEKLAKLLELWVKGLDLDWSKLYGDVKPRRMSLPLYPFARERYWLDVAAARPAITVAAAGAVLHPLLHRNVSDPAEHRYSSTFTDGKALSPAAYLEMARAAIDHAFPAWRESSILELHDVAWTVPTSAAQRIDIALIPAADNQVDFEIYSAEGERELVHCQGVATVNRDAAAVEITGPPQRLQFQTAADYVMPPALFDAALPAPPFALDLVRVIAPCSAVMLASTRSAETKGEARADVDLCDESGKIAVQIRGARYRQVPAVAAPRKEIVLAASASPLVAPADRKKTGTISLAPPSALIAAAPKSDFVDRGDGIFQIDVRTIASLRRALERLQQEGSLKVLLVHGLGDVDDTTAPASLAAFPYPTIAVLAGDCIGNGFVAAALCDFMVCSETAHYGYTPHATPAALALFAERFGNVAAQDLLRSSGTQLRAKGWTCPIVPAAEVDTYARALAANLADKSREALTLLKRHLTRRLEPLVDAWANARPSAQPESDRVFIATLEDLGQRLAENQDAKAAVLVIDGQSSAGDLLELRREILNARIPIVAALEGDAAGEAWLAGLFCDAAVYTEAGVYSAAGMRDDASLATTAAAALADHFGSDAGREILLTGAAYSGRDLQQRVGSTVVAEQNEVRAAAMRVASTAAKRKRTTVVTTPIAQHDNVATGTSIALRSDVVTATVHPGGVVVVKMHDRQAKNMFSEELRAGLAEAFAEIERGAYKVVVLTGYDSYFASGGTKESLLAIQAGEAKFTDTNIYRAALDCKVPVIAAMQGHGIGAGWCLGMFADVVLLSEESQYVSPYMKYGFTPGAGATWVLPERLGADLARESMLTAQPVTGRELRERGLRLRILPRAQVEAAAMTLAEQIARAPRNVLIALKAQWVASVRQSLEETLRLEVAMHERTFVGQADTLAQIQAQFQEAEAAQPVRIEAAPRAADASDALPAVMATLRTLLATELQMRESDVDENTQFIDLGLDSISGVTWIRKINEHYGLSIEATKVYNYPTLAQLGRYVKDEAEKQGTLPKSKPVAEPAVKPLAVQPVVAAKSIALPEISTPVARVRNRRRRSEAALVVEGSRPLPQIAVVGMAGQFPQANDLEQFWRNIAEGRNCIAEIPRTRWDRDAYYQPGEPAAGKTYSQWLGALEQYDRFDPRFFNISPTEAENMDPQQRLFLEACWHSIEDAGYDARALSGSKCGVFVGCATGDYHLASRPHLLSAHGFTGSATSILAARISYFLNLQGPCVSIDTACSSSLVAIAQACDSLVAGDSDVALAGGVYVMGGPEMHIRTAQAGMLSPEGRCYSFDERADGFVPGEGVGVVMLKRLADAERDGDVIYGVVQGWGMNQDGRTNGITAPNPESQTRLEREVYDKYRIDPANIQLIEAHGTGTKLGDPIEVEALNATFKKYTRNNAYCALGSVKSNIGHCLTAAGVAGFIKAIQAIQHRQLPPTINFERLNEHIDLKDSPFYVNTRLQAWERGTAPARLAAISALGFSGTNAHVVVGEYVPVVDPARPAFRDSGATLVPLSARTPEQLEQKARDLLAFLRNAQSPVDLADVAYTLQVGRQPMDERLAFVVDSIDALIAKLDAYVAGKQRVAETYRGRVQRNDDALSLFSSDADLQETIDKWLAHGKLTKLSELWVKGLELDWSKLYGAAKPRRVRLPKYPFAKERYWIEPEPESGRAIATSILHPLLHANVSDLNGQRYRSTFGDGPRVLPAVACLEMARAAIEHALPEQSGALELLDVVWEAPIVINENTDVDVSVAATENGEIEFDITGEGDVVHCRGRAVWSNATAPAAVDLQQFETRQLRVADFAADYVLHPSVIESALQAQPVALENVRILAPCRAEMVACVRNQHDIDLCDPNGAVCVQMRGVSLPVAATVPVAPVQTIGSLLAAPVWRASDIQPSNDGAFADHHVIVCELPAVELPGIQCLHLEAAPGETLAQRYSRYAVACFERLRHILEEKPRGKVLVQIAVPADGDGAVLAGLSGLLQTAALENAQIVGQLVSTTAEDLSRRLLEEKSGAVERHVLYVGGVRHVMRWQEAEADAAPPVAFKDDGIYLITGGTGGLGTLFANEILKQTKRARVVLTGRSAKHDTNNDRVTYRQVDLNEPDQVRQLIAGIEQELGPLTGILHCAGATADNFIVKKTAAEFASVLEPKVAGTVHLDEATRHANLDFFVVFSSIAAALGNPGQADYAVANGFLDQFAAHRNRLVAAGERHGRTRSINWPLWQAGGMALDPLTLQLLEQSAGMQPMQTATGLNAFHRSLALSHDQSLVVEGQLTKVRAYLQKADVLEPTEYQYANKAEEFYSDTTSRASVEFKEEYLTFAPFEEKRPGFSMSRVLLNPEEFRDEANYVLEKQIEMRQVLFCKENFRTMTSVLDFGCGHGTDVIQIGQLFPHIQAHGCTITRDQAILGSRRIAAKRLDASRVQIHHQDSSKVPFPSRYDLVFGVEVSFHIRDKMALWGNICRSLNDRGRVVLADYITNLHGAVQDPNVEISIPTQKEWARLTAQFQLEIDEIIDVSPEIANFLYDPELLAHIATLPEVTRKTLTNYANQSASLERGWLSYVLIKLQRNPDLSREELEALNLQRIQNPTPYPMALDAMRRQTHVDYPPRTSASVVASPQLPVRPVATTRTVTSAPVAAKPTAAIPSIAELQQDLAALLGSILGLDASTIDIDRSFVEFGLDSFLGVEFIIAINKKYDTELSNIKVFDYPTLRELSSFLQEEIRKVAPAVIAQPITPAEAPRLSVKKKSRVRPVAKTTSDDRIAIIGMSGRYPQANDLSQYWTNLADGRNCIVEVPRSRWDVQRYYDPDPAREDKTNSKWLGALDDIDCFDPLFFRISPQEAEYMDPQHRLFLEEGYKAFEDAGYAGPSLSNRKCGVYLGISTNEYASLLLRNGVLSAPVTSNSYAIAAARIAYYLNLKGPAISVDTACSSSLVAIHLACQGLLNGETDMALAGGVTLWLTPESYLAMSRAGMFSSVGQCKTFDDSADGIVVGEGVGALVLKRLKDAEADGDFIYGVLLGSGINQDGKTNGITAPSVNSQIELERAIYAKHGIDPETISYVETHGTGTRLGDPIELEALATVFREKTSRRNFCALGAVKSNIGHTTAAAGVAGVQKVLLSMRNRTLVPSLNFTKENSRFDFANSPFYVSRETTAWNVAPASRRRAAVSSFGFSGTNAHLVLEEYVPAEATPAAARPCVVPLSARNAEQLRQKALDLRDALVNSQPIDLVSVAYTLQVGREAMEERTGFLVSSVDELIGQLNAYVAGEAMPIHSGDATLDLWLSGANVDWKALDGDARPRRVPLPTYPFAKERYWIADRGPRLSVADERAVEESFKSLEDIINRIDDDTIDTAQAVEALKTLV